MASKPCFVRDEHPLDGEPPARPASAGSAARTTCVRRNFSAPGFARRSVGMRCLPVAGGQLVARARCDARSTVDDRGRMGPYACPRRGAVQATSSSESTYRISLSRWPEAPRRPRRRSLSPQRESAGSVVRTARLDDRSRDGRSKLTRSFTLRGRAQNVFAADFHSRRRCAMSWARSSSLPPSSTWRSEGSARR